TTGAPLSYLKCILPLKVQGLLRFRRAINGTSSFGRRDYASRRPRWDETTERSSQRSVRRLAQPVLWRRDCAVSRHNLSGLLPPPQRRLDRMGVDHHGSAEQTGYPADRDAIPKVRCRLRASFA